MKNVSGKISRWLPKRLRAHRNFSLQTQNSIYKQTVNLRVCHPVLRRFLLYRARVWIHSPPATICRGKRPHGTLSLSMLVFPSHEKVEKAFYKLALCFAKPNFLPHSYKYEVRESTNAHTHSSPLYTCICPHTLTHMCIPPRPTDVVSGCNLVRLEQKQQTSPCHQADTQGLCLPISPSRSNYTDHGCDELQTKHL